MQLSSETEREPLLTWKATAPKSHPVDYFVPNFGVDHDVVNTHDHIRLAEYQLNHKWHWPAPPKADGPPSYEIRDIEPEMKDSLQHLSQQEKVYGEWILPPKED